MNSDTDQEILRISILHDVLIENATTIITSCIRGTTLGKVEQKSIEMGNQNQATSIWRTRVSTEEIFKDRTLMRTLREIYEKAESAKMEDLPQKFVVNKKRIVFTNVVQQERNRMTPKDNFEDMLKRIEHQPEDESEVWALK